MATGAVESVLRAMRAAHGVSSRSLSTFPGHSTNPAHPGREPIDELLSPRSVAVIGASEREGSVGRTLFWNLISNPFGGTVYPINKARPNVLGVKAYPSLKELPERVELAVIVTPAPTVPALVEECGQAGIRAVIIISAGFKELGAPGKALEDEIAITARKYGIRIIGPNCLGVMNPLTGFNATFGGVMARPGNVAFISQSGALCTAILDWADQMQVGFSSFISVGSMLDVGWGDLIDHLGRDTRTKSIIIYMESVGDARSFLSAAREIARSKPIIVIKAGRTNAAAKAAASHTGSLTGSDAVLDAAFKRCGVLRVRRIDDLFHLSEVLAKQPLPKGRHLTVITNAGGPGVLATDELISGGGALAPVSEAVMERYNAFLPPHWSRNNPIDILGDADPERYGKALEVSAGDEGTDGTLVILTPQDMTEPTQTAERLKHYAAKSTKPVLASWMGGGSVAAGISILNRANIPTFPYPDLAVRMFNYMWKYERNLQALYETPELSDQAESNPPDTARAKAIMDAVRSSGRTLLTEYESKQLLASYGIPTVTTERAADAAAARAAADKIGYPVVIKIDSTTITHKTDVGGVKLNLKNAQEVESAFAEMKARVLQDFTEADFLGVTVQPMIKLEGYEIIIGSSLDAQFGPVLLFGTGGQLVEVFKDRAVALPPLNSTLARRMMEKTKIYKALKGVRGREPANLRLVEDIMVRFSQLVSENRVIAECDINPLLVGAGDNIIALDARVVLHDASIPDADLPRTVVRPYPHQYVKDITVRDGSTVRIRPIRPEDEGKMVEFHQTLSERSVTFRYFKATSLGERVDHDRLTRICFIDYSREMALVATTLAPNGQKVIAGVIRMVRDQGDDHARFAMIVNDDFQKRGIGTALLEEMLHVAKTEGITHLQAAMLPGNVEMQKLCKHFNFSLIGEAGSTIYADLQVN
jgi:acetyltransferase